MKHLLITVFTILSLSTFANDGNGYEYTVDLTRVENDKVYVELKAPAISDNEIVFYLPKIIPGTYSIHDYGRFVSEFTAYDKKGKELEVERIDDNSWKIKKAKKLTRLSYWVEDSFDTELEGPDIFQPAGTNIEDGENFILNTAGFFGYFEGMKQAPFKFNVIRDESFYGGTGLIPVETGKDLTTSLQKENEASISKKVDTFLASDYDELVDSPLMYAEADTAVIKVSNTEVLISSYSPNKVINADQIAATIEEVLSAQSKYLGGKLPVDKYAFIFYFTDEPVTSFGALEHSYSSLYFIPEQPIQALQQQMRDFAAHEFFHIVTPLTIHSEEIHEFDFNDPKMSEHLWLYEGVTEYFAGNVQVKYGLISPEQYLQVIREKMNTADQFLDTVPFTDISKYTLDQYKDQYYNVYQKGALIGMSLDIMLRDLSDGEYGMQELIADLSEKYGKEKAFKDEDLFAEIEALTYPEIGEFLREYVAGGTPIDYTDIFSRVGINYMDKRTFMDVDMGLTNEAIGVDPEAGHLYIRDASATTEFGKLLGFEDEDVLLKINDIDFPPLGPELGQFLGARRGELEVGKLYSYTVLRNGEEVKLEAEVKEFEQIVRHILQFDEAATEEQQNVLRSWLQP